MFLNNKECLKYCTDNKLFELKDKDMSVIAKKTGKNSLEHVANPTQVKEKLKNNIIIDDKSDIILKIDFGVFKDYDLRQQEIEHRQDIIKELKKQCFKFLNIKKCVICKGYNETLKAVNLETKEFKVIDKDLIDDKDIIKYHESTIKTCLNDSKNNRFKKAYDIAVKAWSKL